MRPADLPSFESYPHGTRARYSGARCRCDDCRRANTAYERERAKARAAGDWNGLVDAGRVREHMRKLSAAGVGRRKIADISGVAETVLQDIRNGSKTKIRARSERAILAVTAEAGLDDQTLLAGQVAHRQIAELVALGFTRAELARRLGHRAPALQYKTTKLRARTIARIDRLYRELRREHLLDRLSAAVRAKDSVAFKAIESEAAEFLELDREALLEAYRAHVARRNAA
jgi:hypothetical protein